ncbi:unnamed protein product [Periconia digitata]|uniref:FAD-binding PCMH-type domain-containing protein n=1 Tax=Periconia digitata TaxID=1303443 RepID=A0A9W4USK0_9PLEO|nr:unnamed protein product [Periconia digitata]
MMRNSAFALSCLAALVPTVEAVSYCLPDDSCFPSEDELQQFNATVKGRLIKVVPYAQACYEDTYDAEACKELAAKRQDPTWRMSLPAGLIYTTWEQAGDEGCYIPLLPADGSSPAPIQGKCSLGGMSSLPEPGQDILGYHPGSGSFPTWMHHMNSMESINNFSPKRNSGVGQRVISAGPGVLVQELYDFGARYDVITTGGYGPTVGATGGFILGGGTGPFSSTIGLGIDNVVQFDVVTADGEEKAVNECTNPDLFWAMRGGGGVFGVHTRVYLKTHTQPAAVNWMVNLIRCDDDSSFKKLISTMIEIQLSLREKGEKSGLWTSNTKFKNIVMISIAPQFGVPVSTNATLNAFAPIFQVPGCQASPKTGTEKQWNDVFRRIFWHVITRAAPSGTNILDSSRIVTYEQMESESGRQRITEYITNLSPNITFLWQNSVGGPTRDAAPDATSVNPIWREAFAFVNAPINGPVERVTEEQTNLQIDNTRNMTKAFGTAAYYSEANEFEVEWQESFFGSNYARLLKIKNEVDPQRVFNCRLCVGSEEGY